VTEARRSLWRRRRWLKWVAGGTLFALAIIAVIVDLGLRRAEPFLRARLVEELEDHFHARVELDNFHVSLVKGLWAEGKGLRIWPPAQVEGVGVPAGRGEPLIRLEEFRFHAPLDYLPGKPIHISVAELKGLTIDLPPRSHFEHAADGADGSKSAGKPKMAGADGSKSAGKPKMAGAGLVSFEVDTIECTDAKLVMETSRPGKLPLVFQIARLKLTGIASGGQIGYDAELTNPRPKGTIKTNGSFGPWLTADPGETAIQGSYRFKDADLADFKGIAGILSSTGDYKGTLRNLVVDGQTETPDFRLTRFGNALQLKTHFHARVDGTNGDTWLEPVDATLGRSHFTATGQIVRVPGKVVEGTQQFTGHDIALDVVVDKARIEDFMRLAGKSTKVLLTGDVTSKTALKIPPGPLPVHRRLKLDGWFALDHAQFTSQRVQGRIAELSLRGQGRPDELKTTDPASILSQMQGRFKMASGTITLPEVEYTVPGAKIELKGTYALEGGGLNFEGTAKMEASVSKMVGGWKGLLLTPADSFFKKGGEGTEFPIHVRGTRDQPEFGVEFGKLKIGKEP
jgi:hypothetical protein